MSGGRQLQVGACVEIVGLTSRPELNGCVGAVRACLASGRVEVRLTPLAPRKATLRDDSPDANGFITNARGVVFSGVSATKAVGRSSSIGAGDAPPAGGVVGETKALKPANLVELPFKRGNLFKHKQGGKRWRRHAGGGTWQRLWFELFVDRLEYGSKMSARRRLSGNAATLAGSGGGAATANAGTEYSDGERGVFEFEGRRVTFAVDPTPVAAGDGGPCPDRAFKIMLLGGPSETAELRLGTSRQEEIVAWMQAVGQQELAQSGLAPPELARAVALAASVAARALSRMDSEDATEEADVEQSVAVEEQGEQEAGDTPARSGAGGKARGSILTRLLYRGNSSRSGAGDSTVPPSHATALRSHSRRDSTLAVALGLNGQNGVGGGGAGSSSGCSGAQRGAFSASGSGVMLTLGAQSRQIRRAAWRSAWLDSTAGSSSGGVGAGNAVATPAVDGDDDASGDAHVPGVVFEVALPDNQHIPVLGDAPLPTPPDPLPASGAHVQLRGLKSKPELNGTSGIVEGGLDDASGRLAIVCAADGETRAFKPDNLCIEHRDSCSGEEREGEMPWLLQQAALGAESWGQALSIGLGDTGAAAAAAAPWLGAADREAMGVGASAGAVTGGSKPHPHGASEGAGGLLQLWPQLRSIAMELREIGSSGANTGNFGHNRGNSWRGGSKGSLFRHGSVLTRAGMQSSSQLLTKPVSPLPFDAAHETAEGADPHSPRIFVPRLVRPPSAAEMQAAASNVAFSSTAAVPAPQAWQRSLWLAVEVSIESEQEAAAVVTRAAAVEAAARAAAAVAPAVLGAEVGTKEGGKEVSVPMLAPQDINDSGALYAVTEQQQMRPQDGASDGTGGASFCLTLSVPCPEGADESIDDNPNVGGLHLRFDVRVRENGSKSSGRGALVGCARYHLCAAQLKDLGGAANGGLALDMELLPVAATESEAHAGGFSFDELAKLVRGEQMAKVEEISTGAAAAGMVALPTKSSATDIGAVEEVEAPLSSAPMVTQEPPARSKPKFSCLTLAAGSTLGVVLQRTCSLVLPAAGIFAARSRCYDLTAATSPQVSTEVGMETADGKSASAQTKEETTNPFSKGTYYASGGSGGRAKLAWGTKSPMLHAPPSLPAPAPSKIGGNAHARTRSASAANCLCVREELSQTLGCFSVPALFLEHRARQWEVTVERQCTVARDFSAGTWRATAGSLKAAGVALPDALVDRCAAAARAARARARLYASLAVLAEADGGVDSCMTFRPSVLKGDCALAGVPINLHVQLFTVLRRQEEAEPDGPKAGGAAAELSHVHDFVTVGAFAAHSDGFAKGGGLRRMLAACTSARRELNLAEGVAAASAEVAAAAAAEISASGSSGGMLKRQAHRKKMEKADRGLAAAELLRQRLVDVELAAAARLDIVASQALATLHASFCAKLDLCLLVMKEHANALAAAEAAEAGAAAAAVAGNSAASSKASIYLTSYADAAAASAASTDLSSQLPWALATLDAMRGCGFLVCFESLLSTTGKELGMLEDHVAGCGFLRGVSFRLVAAPELENEANRGADVGGGSTRAADPPSPEASARWGAWEGTRAAWWTGDEDACEGRAVPARARGGAGGLGSIQEDEDEEDEDEEKEDGVGRKSDKQAMADPAEATAERERAATLERERAATLAARRRHRSAGSVLTRISLSSAVPALGEGAATQGRSHAMVDDLVVRLPQLHPRSSLSLTHSHTHSLHSLPPSLPHSLPHSLTRSHR